MSRTYNSKYKYNKAKGIVNYPNGYTLHNLAYGDINYSSDNDYDYDYSHSTDNNNDNSRIECTRHPNKKKSKCNLSKEFYSVGLQSPSKYKDRFGDAYDRSDRTHLSRIELAHRRRHRLKEQTKKIIEESI